MEAGAEFINIAHGSDGDRMKEVVAATNVPGPANQSATPQCYNTVLEPVNYSFFDFERQGPGKRTAKLHGHGGETRGGQSEKASVRGHRLGLLNTPTVQDARPCRRVSALPCGPEYYGMSH